MCDSILDHIQHPRAPFVYPSPWKQPDADRTQWKVRLVFLWRYAPHKSVAINVVPVDSNEDWEYGHLNDGSYITWLRVRASTHDVSAQWTGAVRLLAENTATDQALEHAMIWLRDCLCSQDCMYEESHEDNVQILDAMKESRHAWEACSELRRASQHNYTDSLTFEEEIMFLWDHRCPSTFRAQLVGPAKPARLIQIMSSVQGSWPGKVDSLPQLEFRLIDTPTFSVPYVALSYRWGMSSPVWQTTTDNFDDRHASIDSGSLPKTLSDAILFTARMGISYIWIDSICIIQDDGEDWAREASLMASVYQGAVFTIAADRAEDSTEGIFNLKSDSPFSIEESFDITTTLSNGEESRIFLFEGKSHSSELSKSWRDMGDLVLHSKLRDRGWVLQERLLSPRIIHFSTDQLYWECHHGMMQSEDLYYRNGRSETLMKLKQRVEAVTAAGTVLSESFIANMERALWRYWYWSVVDKEYSHRSLTRAADKLVAVSGVARVIADMWPRRSIELRENDQPPWSYFAGHFRYDILRSLCWERSGPGRKATGRSYRAPSWSWASQDSPVELLGTQNIDLLDSKIVAEFVDASWFRDQNVAFSGKVLEDGQGWICIKARSSWGAVKTGAGHDFTEHTSLADMFGFPAQSIPPPKEKCSLLRTFGQEYSDLVWLDDDADTYENDTWIDVVVLLMSEEEKDGERTAKACLICTRDESGELHRIGYTECLKEDGNAPKEGPPLCECPVKDVMIV